MRYYQTELWKIVYDAMARWVDDYDFMWHQAYDVTHLLLGCDFGVQGALPETFSKQKEIMTLMAKKTAKDNSTVPWKGFINIYMDAASKADFLAEDWMEGDTLDDMINNLLITGHLLSLKYDVEGQYFMSSMRGNNPDSPNAGYCITSRHPDAVTALKLALYKHYVLCQTDWTQYAQPDSGKGWG